MEVAIAVQELIKESRTCEHSMLKIPNFKEVGCWDEFVVTTFVGASGVNRPKGGRTGGALVCMAPPTVLEGDTVDMSLMAWRSWHDQQVQSAHQWNYWMMTHQQGPVSDTSSSSETESAHETPKRQKWGIPDF